MLRLLVGQLLLRARGAQATLRGPGDQGPLGARCIEEEVERASDLDPGLQLAVLQQLVLHHVQRDLLVQERLRALHVAHLVRRHRPAPMKNGAAGSGTKAPNRGNESGPAARSQRDVCQHGQKNDNNESTRNMTTCQHGQKHGFSPWVAHETLAIKM